MRGAVLFLFLKISFTAYLTATKNFYDDVTNEILWDQRLRLTEATLPLITCVPEIADKLKHFHIDKPRFDTRIHYVSNLLITLFWQCK